LKILVTGTAGFIGFHLVNELLKNKRSEIVGLDNINDYYDINLKHARLKETGIHKQKIKYNTFIRSSVHPNYRFIKLDLIDKENLLELFRREKFNYVIHLAAQAGVRYSLENPESYIDSNITGFLNILEACRHYPVKHLLFASSSSVYGANKKIPFSESDRADSPVSLYGATKKSNELMAHSYAHLFNIPVTGLRFFTVYGPWGRPDMALFLFTKAILNNEPINVFNYGKMKRDFTYIDDIIKGVSGLLKKISASKAAGENFRIFNIGNHRSVQLMQLITILEKKINKKAKLNLLPIPPGDVPNTFADITKLNDTGIKLTHKNLEYGIGKFIDWYKQFYSC